MSGKPKTAKGTCWLVDLGSEADMGDVLYKTRPCVVVSADSFNERSNCLTVVPISSSYNKKRKKRNTHTKINTEKVKGVAVAEQMRIVSKNQLRGYIEQMSKDVMQSISENIACHLFDNDFIVTEKDEQ